MEELIKIIVNFFENIGELPETKITSKTDIRKDLGMDSLDASDLLLFIEEEYNMELNIDEMYDLHTVEDIYNFIQEHKKIREYTN